MSWDSEIVLLLRNYVGDTDTTNQKYTDDSLISLILTAAQFVIMDAPLSQTYTLSIENETMSPDPTSRATETSRDDAFINLIILKSVWMMCNAELKIYGSQAISIRDGTSAVDLKRDMKALQSILNDHRDAYFEFKDRYIRENYQTGQIITTPYNVLSTVVCGNDYFSPLLRQYRW